MYPENGGKSCSDINSKMEYCFRLLQPPAPAPAPAPGQAQAPSPQDDLPHCDSSNVDHYDFIYRIINEPTTTHWLNGETTQELYNKGTDCDGLNVEQHYLIGKYYEWKETICTIPDMAVQVQDAAPIKHATLITDTIRCYERETEVSQTPNYSR